MTALEEIQEAIGTLERLKAEAPEGPWVIEPDSYGNGWLTGVGIGVASTVAPEYIDPADAALIVVLHRTIDAQIAVLKFAAEGLYDLDEFVALARAINGIAS